MLVIAASKSYSAEAPKMKLLLLDLDGTIREPRSGKQFISHPRDQKIITGAVTALDSYIVDGWNVIGVSNQEGVAAGHKTLEEALSEAEYTLLLFPHLDGIYFCPDFQGQVCWHVIKDAPAKDIWRPIATRFQATNHLNGCIASPLRGCCSKRSRPIGESCPPNKSFGIAV